MASDQYQVSANVGPAGMPLPGLRVTASFIVDDGPPLAIFSGIANISEAGVALESFRVNKISSVDVGGTIVYTASGPGSIPGTRISISYAGTNPVVVTNVSLNIENFPLLSGSTGAISSAPVPCFTSGTLIRTPSGDMAIERLKVGDLVLTAACEERAIKWLGHETIACEGRDREDYLPVRICRDAFAAGMPAKDLYVSPGHAICVSVLDDILVPASVLVNGTTITRVDVESVTYWHLELESHDIVLANNLPSETYINVGNRSFDLDGSGAAVDPDRSVATLVDYCRPSTTHPTLVSALRRMLRLRAIKLGWTLEESPLGGLHLMVDGAIVMPQVRGLTASFLVHAQAKDVWLVSQTSVPAHLDEVHDTRRLGVLVRDVAVDDGFAPRRHLDLRDSLFSEGFSHVEEMDGRAMRWTLGRARIPSAVWSDCSGSFLMRVELNAAALPRWVEPLVQATAPAVLTLVKAA